jgi:hypothetical protein
MTPEILEDFLCDSNPALTLCDPTLRLTLPSPVRDARRQRIKIVSLDWLEDSLLSSTRKPKREKEYEVRFYCMQPRRGAELA